VESRDPHLGPGSGVVLWAETERSVLGGDSLGERDKPAEVVGREAATKLIEDLRTEMAYDRHMGDMVVPYLALADGESVAGLARLTMHAHTNIWLVRRVLGVELEHRGELNQPAILKVRGRPPR